MKKQITLFVLAIATLGIIAALTYYPNAVVSSNFVLNPSNILSSDYAYATLQYATNITCPLGLGWTTYSGAPSNFCIHNGSGQIIGGWEIVSYNSSAPNLTRIVSSASDLNLGCTSCSLTTGYRLFYSKSSVYNATTSWTYAGTCPLADNANMTTCTLNVTSTSINYLLVSRDAGGNFRPDPAVHWIRTEN